MGKTEKVVKKDKIKALRKKYDDFLEDDKKRRDRNVYILERLEKMRSCVATLQTNQMGVILSNSKPTTENPVYVNNSSMLNNDRILMRRDLMGFRENQLDDTSILKEISKKYILIPKTHSMLPKYPVMDLENNDSDWRSKYNILEQLKRNEKEEPPERDVGFSATQDYLHTKHDIHSEIVNKINESDFTSKPPSSVSLDERKFTTNYDNKEIPSRISNTIEEIQYTDKVTDKPVTVKNTNSSINNQSVVDQIQNQKGLRDNTENILVQENEEDKQKRVIEETTLYENKSETFAPDQQEKVKVNEVKSENNTQEDIVEKVTSEEINSKNNDEKDIDRFNNDYVDTIQIEETQELETKPITIPDESKVNEFDTEQREILYSENFNTIVENNREFEEPETYASDNNYTNDQYNYYKESQSQQVQNEQYGNVIDEHQEATGNYDQNYEQQYVNSYENEYSNQYENQPFENYETDNNYQAENSNFEYQQSEQINAEYTNSENYIPSVPAPETNTNLSDNQENYKSQENESEIYPQQENIQHEMHDLQHEYFEQNHDEIQQHLNVENDYVENQENKADGNIGDDTIYQHEMHDMQHEHIEQNHNEIQQHLNVENDYVENQENTIDGNIYDNTIPQQEMHDLQHDYVAQNHDEIQQEVDVEDAYVEGQANKVDDIGNDKHDSSG